MNQVRLALANVQYPSSREHSVALVEQAVAEAGAAGATLIAFPECFIPGYRAPERAVAPPDARFLERAWSAVAAACAKAKVAAVVGTERFVAGELRLTALVCGADGSVAGFQDKVQLDPTEEGGYVAGAGRHIFHAGTLAFGIVICHEGWRYPETVRWAVRHGAKLVLHPHFSWAEPGSYRPTTFAHPENSFHEKAMLCRAAENTCWFASINYATEGAPTTSAIVRPDGTLLAYQPYGLQGILVADIDLDAATGLLASRCLSREYHEA